MIRECLLRQHSRYSQYVRCNFGQMKKVAIDIRTEKLYSIINILRKDGWTVSAKYYGFDAGIDDDYWCLRRGLKN